MTDTLNGTHDDPPVVVAALDDQRAMRALEIVVFRDRPPTAGELRTRGQLAEAAAATDSTPFRITTGLGEPDLARATLIYLSTQPDRVADLRKAIDLSADTTRVEPGTLIVGGLIVLALQTQISLSRDPEGRWRFTFLKNALKDSALGTLLGKLIGTYGVK